MATCENCGERLPRSATSCPSCGVFTGRKPPRDEHARRMSNWPIVIALLLVAGIGGAAYYFRDDLPGRAPKAAPAPPPIRVVRDRPGVTRKAAGAKLSEAEAILTLRNHLARANGIEANCVAILSNGLRGGTYTFTARNHCGDVRLGRWAVDGRSGAVRGD
ncbi:MAG TPA: hypothetical protein VF698_02990 [Thermoanaerobaculia bacterium]|jgi:hypothetical protein